MFSMSPRNAESCKDHVNKSLLDPTCAKFYKKSEFGHLRTCQGQTVDGIDLRNTYRKESYIYIYI